MTAENYIPPVTPEVAPATVISRSQGRTSGQGTARQRPKGQPDKPAIDADAPPDAAKPARPADDQDEHIVDFYA